METTQQISKPEDFERETRVITLPRPTTTGKKLVVKIGHVGQADWFTALEGIPEIAEADRSKITEAQARQFITSSEGPTRKLAALGIVEPEFSYGTEPEAGKAWWGHLHRENQDAVINALRDLSGIGKSSPDGGAASRAASFPPGPAGAAGSTPA